MTDADAVLLHGDVNVAELVFRIASVDLGASFECDFFGELVKLMGVE